VKLLSTGVERNEKILKRDLEAQKHCVYKLEKLVPWNYMEQAIKQYSTMNVEYTFNFEENKNKAQ
jgi:hypothetical protein